MVYYIQLFVQMGMWIGEGDSIGENDQNTHKKTCFSDIYMLRYLQVYHHDIYIPTQKSELSHTIVNKA